MILLRFRFLLLKWHGWFLGCISKMCLHLTRVRIGNQCDIIANTDDEGFCRPCCRATCRKKKEKEKKARTKYKSSGRTIRGESRREDLHHSSSNLHSYSQQAHFKMWTIQSYFFHLGRKKNKKKNALLMFPWPEQNKAPLSSYWKWGHSPWCGSLSVKERMTEEGSKETVQVYTTTSIVTTEHFDVAIKTHWSLDMLTYLCKESLSSWPQKKRTVYSNSVYSAHLCVV